ncbi:MAG TPA: SRPBCC family protein [Iamia sp.]|nr:SRPBCC family protein [Iamia sp.]
MADIQIDTDHRLTSVTRTVEPAEREGKQLKAVVASEVYPSPPADVWDALTNAERLPRWFLPITGELKLGGSYQLEGNAGGEILECEPEERFLVSWVYDGFPSWVEVTLTPEGDGTRMRLSHFCDCDNPFWDQFGPGATGVGWDSGLIGLSLHLATGEPVDRAAYAKWEASADARPFMIGAAEAWGEADVAGGEEPDVARRRAGAVGAFYTGEGPGVDDMISGEPTG